MTYRERLAAPVLWWVVALGFAATFVVAVAVFLPGWFATVFGVVATAGVVVFLWFTAPTIGAGSDGLMADRAVLEREYVGGVRVLEGEALTARLRTQADPRAFVVYRSYAESALEVEVTDPADPHPYWLVSTRHPQEVLAALGVEAVVTPPAVLDPGHVDEQDEAHA